MRRAAATFAILAGLSDFISCLVIQKQDPTVALRDFEEKTLAKEFMDTWRPKGWDTARNSCDTAKLPATTNSMIFKVCGQGANMDRCVCNIAKAHSCHTGCRKLGTGCPSQCKHQTCKAGPSNNGGMQLSGGDTGVCYKYCSPRVGLVRSCGVGPDYQSGLFLDCTGCDPSSANKQMSIGEKKERWTSCVADCFPTPTCADMCAAGTPDCYARCVEKYREVVEPYWDIFKGSLQDSPLKSQNETAVMTVANTTAANDVTIKTANHPKPVYVDPVEAVKDVAKDISMQPEVASKTANPPTPVNADPVEGDSNHAPDEDEEWEDEEWEDPWAGHHEWDEEGYGDDWEDDYDDEEWEDPWAGQNEWDEEGYGDNWDDEELSLVRERMKRTGRTWRSHTDMTDVLKKARSLGLTK